MKRLLVVLAVLAGLITAGCVGGVMEPRIFVLCYDYSLSDYAIWTYSADGEYVGKFAAEYWNVEDGICVDASNNVYLIRWRTPPNAPDQIRKRSKEGTLLLTKSIDWGMSLATAPDGYIYERGLYYVGSNKCCIIKRDPDTLDMVSYIALDHLDKIGFACDADGYFYTIGAGLAMEKWDYAAGEKVASHAITSGTNWISIGCAGNKLLVSDSRETLFSIPTSLDEDQTDWDKSGDGFGWVHGCSNIENDFLIVGSGGGNYSLGRYTTAGQKVWATIIEHGDNITVYGVAAYPFVADKEAPWKEDILEPTGEVKVEIPRRSGEWTTLPDVMRIHTSNGKDTSSPRAPIEIGQAEVTCSNISRNFNSFEEASDWYKNLEGYALQIKVGCKIGGSPISVKLFTGIISSVDVDRLSQTAEIRVVDFLDYFGRVTIEETPVWEGISLTQLFKNLVELAFPEWVEGTDYFVEDLGGSTIPAIGYTDLNLLSELKMIAESRGMRLYTDTSGRLHCASRNPERDPLTVSYDYNLEDVTERRNIDSIINWVEVHARPHEIQPDTTPPGKVSGFTATPGDQKIDLSWSNPTDDDFDKVRIVYSTSAYPTNEGEGTQIYEGTGISKSHTGLTNGTRYYYSAFTADDTGNWSDAAHTSAVAGVGEDTWGDETETSPVTNFKAEAGHEKITLTWTNPKTADFSLVEIRWSTTDYPGSVTDGSQLYQGTAQTKVHSGLTIGTRYYYTAFAQNSGGEWSGGTHASAIPGLEGGGTDGEFREELATYSIRDSHYAWQDAKDYFSSWTYKKKFNFRIPYGRYTASWLRFKHRWDVKCYADMKYISNQKHVSGQKDDLTLNSTHDCNEIAICKTVYISLYSSAVSIFMEYTLSYKGGNIKEIHINNTLSLMG